MSRPLELTFTGLTRCDACGGPQPGLRLSGLCQQCQEQARESAKRSWGRAPRKRPRSGKTG